MFGHLPIVFDSATLPERDRYGYAREQYGRKALNVDLEAAKDTPFRLRLRAREFGPVRIAIIESTPYRVRRTRSLIDDGDDRIGLVFPLAGRFGGEQGQRDVTVGRGQATTMLANRTGWFGTPTGGAFLTIRAAPPFFESDALDLRPVSSGAVIRPSRGGFNLLRSYLTLLNRADFQLPAALQEAAGRHIAELAAHAFCAEANTPRTADGEGLRAARAGAALAHIAAHCHEPAYDISACALHLGLSVRSLQKILEATDTSFSVELKRRRLERALALLSDPANHGLRITDIAFDCGFSDVSYFNRQFRKLYGDTPTGFRRH